MLQKALDFLKSHKEVAFATCEGGRPHIRVFQIMKQEGATLYFATSPEKRVFRQLQDNPCIEVMASSDNVFVKCSGRADFAVGEAAARWIYDHNSVLPRLYSSWDKLACFRLAVEQLDYYDLTPTPPVFKHYDLASGTESDGFVGERYSRKA